MKNLPYLNEEEKRRFSMILNEIDDAMNAIKIEMSSREHPYKTYLSEKLRTLQIDVPCLASMLEDKGDDTDDEEIL